MIRYSLGCDQGHAFDSWFRDSAGYDTQVAGGLVACPVCGSTMVAKAIMAPFLAPAGQTASAAVAPAAVKREESAPAPSASEAPAPVVLASDKDREMRAMLRAMRRFVEATSDDVGRRFPEEARRMHTGEIEHRAIRGEANGEEVRALLDEGVEVHPLPTLPDERN